MPCHTIQTSKIEFLSASTDLDLLERAMEALGLHAYRTRDGLNGTWGRYEAATGRLELPDYVSIDTVKRAYSKQAVIQQQQKYGWQVTWTRDSEGNEVASVAKRRF